jgi:hypothetical protein
VSITAVLIELNLAEIEDSAARAEAMHQGLVATQPLTATRLRELCVLGEKMMYTGRRKARALARARELFA